VPHAERDDLHAAVRGQQAVTAGLALPCSSAAMEGNVNKITMIKRQMYGRAAVPSCASASSSTLGNHDCKFGARARSTGQIRDSGAVDSPEIEVMPAPRIAI